MEHFQDLYRQYFPQVVLFFQRRRFSYEESLELAQDTFVRVYKGMEDFRQEAQVKTWIFRIALNTLLNRRRDLGAHKRRAVEVPLETGLDGSDAVGGEAGQRALARDFDRLEKLLRLEQSRLLREALGELPPKMRECVMLWVREDLKYKEIAERTGVSVNTVKAHIFQAKRQLKERLAAAGGERSF
nr:RNA polymerase sigma factor [Thermoanaerobaculia bacterium]